MADDRQLEEWWNALSDDERNEALAAQQSGELSPRLVSSLRRQGVLGSDPVQEQGKPLPTEVERFLKARH
jgi:hypothetical protein